MHQRAVVFGVFCLTCLLFAEPTRAGSGYLTPLQTQSTSSSLVATDWGPGTSGLNNPLTFDQFNPHLGPLTSIELTMTTTVRNDYILSFVPTGMPTMPLPTTIFVATSQTSDPSILSDPTKRAMLTDGPTVTLFGPDHTTQLLGPPATRQPVDFVQMTHTSGTWSSLLSVGNPNYIPPTMTQQTLSLTLTAANAPSIFSEFIGTGEVTLPVNAEAFSSFFSSTGNGGGGVLTTANAVVTIQFSYVPEPSSALLFGLGIGLTLLARRRLGRRALAG
jgi:hypothetical protein